MATIRFQKWQGAGNDFVIIDNRDDQWQEPTAESISRMCNRHFGIGADGLMFIKRSQDYAFTMSYYNSDGKPAEMCGNGGRCIAAMASKSGIFSGQASFLANDGPHEAIVVTPDWIRLKMMEVTTLRKVIIPAGKPFERQEGVFLNTGVPHLVIFTETFDGIDVNIIGRELRNLEDFAPAGTNVNLVRRIREKLIVRTYERGVESETLACGTGNVAAAIACEWIFDTGATTFDCSAVGGQLKVNFQRIGHSHFTDIWLEGPAVLVFEGTVDVSG